MDAWSEAYWQSRLDGGWTPDPVMETAKETGCRLTEKMAAVREDVEQIEEILRKDEYRMTFAYPLNIKPRWPRYWLEWSTWRYYKTGQWRICIIIWAHRRASKKHIKILAADQDVQLLVAPHLPNFVLKLVEFHSRYMARCEENLRASLIYALHTEKEDC